MSPSEKRRATETAVDRGVFIMNLDCFMELNTQLYERATLQEIEPMNYESQMSFHLSSQFNLKVQFYIELYFEPVV